MAKAELANRRIECKAIAPRRVAYTSMVEEPYNRLLVAARLRKSSLVAAVATGDTLYTENGADGNIYINITTAIQWVEQAHIFLLTTSSKATYSSSSSLPIPAQLMPKGSTPINCCWQNVQFSYIFSLYVYRACITRMSPQSCFIHFTFTLLAADPLIA